MSDSHNYTQEFLAGYAAGHYTDEDLVDLTRDPIGDSTRLQRLTTWTEIMSYSANTEVVLSENTFWWGRLSDCDIFRACVRKDALPDLSDAKPGVPIEIDIAGKVFLKNEVPEDYVPLFPSCPRGMQLMKMPLHLFLRGLASSKEHLRQHGWDTLLAAYHGNCVKDKGMPWCHKDWIHYCVMIDRGFSEWTDVEDIPGPKGLAS